MAEPELAAPYTLPEPSTDAVPLALLLHAPPPVASLSVIVAWLHTAPAPDMAAGLRLTVIGNVAGNPQPVL